MTKKPGSKFWIVLTVFSLTGQIAWVVENMYFNVFIYKMFNADAQAISLMVAASSVAATVTTLLIGALSDKLGKRKIFICLGYILWGLSVMSFALIRIDVIDRIFPMAVSSAAVGISLTIIMDCVMTFFGSSANDACFNAWLTDSTDNTNRGAAEGINSMMPLVAILAVFGGFMAFDLDSSDSWITIFMLIGSVVTLIGILGFFLIRDPKIDVSQNSGFVSNIFYGLRPGVIRNNLRLYFSLAAFALFGISIQTFMPYLILYYSVSLGMNDYVFIMAPAIILAAVFTAFWGRAFDRFGFMKSIIPSLSLLAAGYILLIFFKTTLPVFLGSLLMMCGYLSGMAVFGAVIRSNTPVNKSGMFQGLRILAQVLVPGLIGPMIGALVLKNAETVVNNDGTVSFIPNENIFVSALVVVIILALLLGLSIFAKNRKERKQVEKN